MKIRKEKTCCFTGHRNIINLGYCRKALRTEIRKMIEQGVDTFVFGGAYGYDLLAMNELYESFICCGEAVNMVLVLPCSFAEQTKNWRNRREIDFLRFCEDEVACKVIRISDKYYNGCMRDRNAKMVELSGYCICYLERERSGTGQTVRMAKRHGLKVINIYANL